MSTYASITIGPILETMAKAQKTRELWAASYFFSYFMRELTKQLKGAGFKILIPGLDEIDNINLLGAGLYHDRIIISSDKSEDSIILSVKKIMDLLLKDTAGKIYQDFEKLKNKKIGKEHSSIAQNNFSESEIEAYLRNYIKLYGNTLQLESGNIIKELSSLSDISDHQPKVLPNNYSSNPERTTTPLAQFFNIVNWSFLFEDAFQRKYDVESKTHHWTENFKSLSQTNEIKKLVNQKPKRGFDSLVEIGTRELKEIAGKSGSKKYDKIIKDHFDKLDKGEISDEENDLINDLENEFNYKIKDENGNDKYIRSFYDYHKYVAIIHSDGDNVGKIVNVIGEDESFISDFSNALIQYNKACAQIIYRNGGAPIFAGGDDLLFLAPVVNGDKNIFDLVQLLEEEFEKKVANKYRQTLIDFYKQNKTEEKDQKFPSISYGLSITFYKFPLYEAKNLSYKLLEEIKFESENKNEFRFKLMKHSGQIIEFTLPKNENNNVNLFDLTRAFIKNQNTNKDFLNSFTYKLHQLRPLILECLSDNEDVSKRLKNFFRNNFNENYKSNSKFYEALIEFIIQQNAYKPLKLDGFGLMYGCLRFIAFTSKK